MLVLTCPLARADGNPLNGAPPRPFYIFAHNPNTLGDVEAALQAGANALEPDITLAFPDTPSARCSDTNLLENLVNWDSSFPHRDGVCSDTKLVAWLQGVHALVKQPQFAAQLALIVFDIKSSAATAENGPLIVDAIRTHLNTDGVNLNVILSVATRNDGAIFDRIIGSNAPVQLGEREGVQIDEEDDAGAVVQYFFGRGYHGNIGFGDGTAGPGPHLPTAMDGAVWSRAATGYPKAVTYVYTINVRDSMSLFLDAGVDGIITDHVDVLSNLLLFRSDVRSPIPSDSVFQSPPEAYALTIRTMNDTHAGTDAHITFTLEGALGSASVTVDTAPTGRMERGNTNHATISSKDLGPLHSITVSNDGDGNAPDWKLRDITVQSARWLKPDASYRYTATLNDSVQGGSTVTLPFRADEYVWSASSSSDGTSSNPWKQVSDAYNAVAPGGTIHITAGSYPDKPTFSKPCKVVFRPDHGENRATIGNP